MDSPKWMPINPCKDCNLKSKPDCEECSEDEVYEIVKAHQKNLLEYLLNQASAMNLTSETIINVVYVSKMLAMFKELEAKDD